MIGPKQGIARLIGRLSRKPVREEISALIASLQAAPSKWTGDVDRRGEGTINHWPAMEAENTSFIRVYTYPLNCFVEVENYVDNRRKNCSRTKLSPRERHLVARALLRWDREVKTRRTANDLVTVKNVLMSLSA